MCGTVSIFAFLEVHLPHRRWVVGSLFAGCAAHCDLWWVVWELLGVFDESLGSCCWSRARRRRDFMQLVDVDATPILLYAI